MLRILLVLLLFTAPCFAKKAPETMPCGCPVDHNVCDEEDPKGRSYPAPVAGVMSSMKSMPGLWTIAIVGGAITGIAFIVADSSSSSISHS